MAPAWFLALAPTAGSLPFAGSARHAPASHGRHPARSRSASLAVCRGQR